MTLKNTVGPPTAAEVQRRIDDVLRNGAKRLDLSNLELSSLPESVFNLAQLEELYIGQNLLTFLPHSLERLSRLRELYAGFNQIQSLPESVGNLHRLRVLDLSGNSLIALPGAITHLGGLRELVLANNRIAELSDSLEGLRELRGLDLSHNLLTTLPNSMRALKELQWLFLHGNRGLGLAPEVLGPPNDSARGQVDNYTNPKGILDFYFASRSSRPLNEAKLILVGRGRVGKTSLVNRLVRDLFDPQQAKTDGIAITPWSIDVGGDRVRLNVWDFGGQEIMHATHQFFLTERSLYLLVVDAGEGEQNANIEYWLRLIASYGGDSPVIMVINKIQDHVFNVNQRALKVKYHSICAFISTDFHSNVGIDGLRNTITQEIDRMPHVRDPCPVSWFRIKEKLGYLSENYISFQQYQALCADCELKDESEQVLLVAFLYDLGIVVNFRRHARLRDTHVLNPRWVTNGIYRILNASKFAERQNGEVHLSELSSVLDPAVYPSDKHTYLLDLMAQFELCYENDEQSGTYLVPELLTVQEPDLSDFDEAQALRFEYRYAIVPEGLLPRYIVRARALNEHLPRWRTGVLLEWDGSRALVKADIHDRCVRITVLGNRTKRRALLDIIRTDFEYIHRSLAKLEVEEHVPVPGHPGSVEYRKLLALKQQGVRQSDEFLGGKLVSVSAGELLDNVEEYASRESHHVTEVSLVKSRPVQVVFSYSHKDEKLRQRLATYLKPLERRGLLEVWHDRKLVPGERWAEVIDERIWRADIVLLLITADFIESDYCIEKELAAALKRHHKGEARVIPVILRQCLWKRLPFSDLQALPKDARPVVLSVAEEDAQAWTEVAEGIERAADDLIARRRADGS